MSVTLDRLACGRHCCCGPRRGRNLSEAAAELDGRGCRRHLGGQWAPNYGTTAQQFAHRRGDAAS
jgi:hypothetical protein